MANKNTPPRNRHKKKKSGNSKTTLSYPRLIITTAITLVFILGLSQLNHLDSPSDDTQKKYGNTQINSDAATSGNESSAPKTRQDQEEYAFYSMLKDFSVKVPAKNEYSKVTKKKQPGSYLIQAGSFKTKRQAEHRLVELTLLGLEPVISDTVNAQGNTWFRVRLGPFHSRTDMASARHLIVANGMEAMVMAR